MPFDPRTKISIKPRSFLSMLEIKITLSEPDYEGVNEDLMKLLKGLLQKDPQRRLRIFEIQQS